MTTILPWRRAAQAVDDNPTTDGHALGDLSPRLTILDLESQILKCTGKLVTLEAEACRVIEQRKELMQELTKRVQSLGLKVEVPK